jgi:hypothetical protein
MDVAGAGAGAGGRGRGRGVKSYLMYLLAVDRLPA